jgi:hypothetical protein
MSQTRLTNEEKKAGLMAGLHDVRTEILKEAWRFHPDEITLPFVGVWSLLDLLAHLAGWDVTNRQAAEEVMNGNVPTFYSYHSKEWADYNSKLVKEYGRPTLVEALITVEQTQQDLLDFLNAIPAKDLFSDHGVRMGSYRVIISRLLEAERKDETRHLRQIVEFLDDRRIRMANSKQ